MSTDTAPSPPPEPLPKLLICGHCLMEITHQSGLRYFGTSVAHQEYECLRLLHAEIERLTAALAAAETDAQRYRWLRSSSNVDGPHVYGPDDDCILEFEACDAAIDAAQKETP